MEIIGNLAMQLAKLMGARVVGWKGLEGRRRIASSYGLNDVYDVLYDDVAEKTRSFAAYGLDFAVSVFGGNGTTVFKQVHK